MAWKYTQLSTPVCSAMPKRLSASTWRRFNSNSSVKSAARVQLHTLLTEASFLMTCARVSLRMQWSRVSVAALHGYPVFPMKNSGASSILRWKWLYSAITARSTLSWRRWTRCYIPSRSCAPALCRWILLPDLSRLTSEAPTSISSNMIWYLQGAVRSDLQ